MRIPRKIDDRLKDAVINVQFLSNHPEAAIWGIFYAKFKEHLRQIPSIDPFKSWNQILGNEVFSNDNTTHFVTKDEAFRIDLIGNEIAFNLIKGYPGWTVYQNILETFLYPLIDDGTIKHVKRLGIRYISHFKNVKIFESIVGVVDLKMPYENPRGHVRLEYINEDFTGVVSLVNNLPIQNSDEETFSLVDIDVIKMYTNESGNTNSQTIKDDIELGHNWEKVLFFTVLSEEFISTLNPEF